LTEKESYLIDLFKGFILEKKLSTVLRIAGGWVRDKVIIFNNLLFSYFKSIKITYNKN